MANRRLVTVVGATGAQGGAVIRGLTRDVNSEKAQALKRLGDYIEMVTCDINKSDDVKCAFKDSWAIYALTDSWAQPDQPDFEIRQGMLMADVAASLLTP
ncbi:unnamed protein product [Didymodactylos carnosus]|uniref:NmrA-like family domain-containing protein 1 n=1 Tax=Didymodactylos carnosus TaxID=1234261 RepID=A0A815IQ82_9BILA|nr:unnamed protein product [Didymodactylos carnosus]CAF1369402.1 unnamed protein product [Didymodactylos carnosus]CAF4051716.1 unnamed protein product [Didymodactylos carnosus]CAF4254172.1 unnamed protein product [Didymodactylos carnosus]